jgi:arginine/lysine/ornithine decarboxylase
MYEYNIYWRLKQSTLKNKTFHMPGHKARGEFKARFKDAYMDITELSYSDNLHSPTGVIAEAQKDIAEIVGAKQSFITTDGSSSGIFAMLYAASKRGNKVIVARNSHRSVWNACAILGLEPLIVQGVQREGMFLAPDVEMIEKLIVNDRNISAILLTSPDYYGNILPLKPFRELADKYNRLLIVDGAHGAHLVFEKKHKGYAGKYADMWVDGAHKTLTTLTQGAVVNVKNESIIPALKEGLEIFRTTSPSYPIMASVEFGIKYPINNPERLAAAKSAVEDFKKDVKDLIPLYPTDDWAKIVMDCKPLEMSSYLVCEQLEKKGIYPELADGRYIVFYLSPVVTYADLRLLKSKILSVIKSKKLRFTYEERPVIPVSDRTYSYVFAITKPHELVPLNEAVGRMCARNAGFTPPCIPVIIAGEIISSSAVATLSAAHSTFGLDDGKVLVVKK